MKTLHSQLGGGNEAVFLIYDVTGVDNLPLDVYLTSHGESDPAPPPRHAPVKSEDGYMIPEENAYSSIPY